MPEPLTIQELTKEFRRYQNQKYSKSGNVEARVLEALCAAAGEHWTAVRNGILRYTHESSGVRVPFNFIRNRKMKLKGRLAAVCPTYKAQPDTSDPSDADQAKIVDKLILAIDQKLGQESITGEILEWLLIGGLAVEHTPWIPNAAREPMPVRVLDSPEVQGQYPFAAEDELVWRDLHAIGEEQALIPASARDFMMQPPEEGGEGRAPESFEPVEELREVGEPGSEIHGPLTFFCDLSVKDIQNLSPDQSIMFAAVKDRSWVEENVDPEEFSRLNNGRTLDSLDADGNIQIIRTDLSRSGAALNGTNLENLLPAIQGSKGPDDPDMFVVLWRYQDRSKKNPDGRFTMFIPEQAILRDGDNPYDDGIPAESYHWEAVTTTFFTSGWVTDLIPANKTFDRVVSDIVDYLKKFAKSPWLGAPPLTEKDFGKGDVSRFIEKGMSPDGRKLVAQADVAQMPAMMMQIVELLKTSLDDLAGGTDLFKEKSFPGQLRGSNAVAWLQEIIDTQYGPIFTHLGERMGRVKQMRINRWKQFVPASRTLHYVSRDDRVETFEFHTSDILRGGAEYNITIERGSLIPELRSMREARILERMQGPLSILYQDDRMPGVFDKSKIAADLQMGDISREGREARARKLARDIIERLRATQPVAPPQPFMDPLPMLDEFEDVMNDMDFMESSPQSQQAVMGYWQALSQMAQERAQQQQQSQMDQFQQGAMAEALQQTLARASAELIDAGKETMQTALQEFVQGLTTDPQFVQDLMFMAGQGAAQEGF